MSHRLNLIKSFVNSPPPFKFLTFHTTRTNIFLHSTLYFLRLHVITRIKQLQCVILTSKRKSNRCNAAHVARYIREKEKSKNK